MIQFCPIDCGNIDNQIGFSGFCDFVCGLPSKRTKQEKRETHDSNQLRLLGCVTMWKTKDYYRWKMVLLSKTTCEAIHFKRVQRSFERFIEDIGYWISLVLVFGSGISSIDGCFSFPIPFKRKAKPIIQQCSILCIFHISRHVSSPIMMNGMCIHNLSFVYFHLESIPIQLNPASQ